MPITVTIVHSPDDDDARRAREAGSALAAALRAEVGDDTAITVTTEPVTIDRCEIDPAGPAGDAEEAP